MSRNRPYTAGIISSTSWIDGWSGISISRMRSAIVGRDGRRPSTSLSAIGSPGVTRLSLHVCRPAKNRWGVSKVQESLILRRPKGLEGRDGCARLGISSARSSAAACPSRLRPAGCAPQDEGRWRLPRPGAGGAAGLLLLFQRRSPCRCQYAKVQEPHPIEACRHIRQPLSGVDSRRTRRKRQGLS